MDVELLLTERQPPDEVSRRLVVQLREAIYVAESKRFLASRAKPVTAMDYKILGDSVIDTQANSLAANREARRYYELALTIDPTNNPALISRGYALVSELELTQQRCAPISSPTSRCCRERSFPSIRTARPDGSFARRRLVGMALGRGTRCERQVDRDRSRTRLGLQRKGESDAAIGTP